MRISRDDYARMVRQIQSELGKAKKKVSGGGPDDYGMAQVMEYYLYRHPMSMMEFYVDHGGIASGGLFKKFKSKWKDMVKAVGKRLNIYKEKAIELAHEKAKKELPAIKERLTSEAKKHGGKITEAAKQRLQKEVGKAEAMGKQLADSAMDRAQAATAGVVKTIKGGGHGMKGCGEDREAEARRERMHEGSGAGST
eukprot:COSAG01_NODE_5803_length_4023_cov_72.687819_4_plen_196_part_00